jgi:hypothetical protein
LKQKVFTKVFQYAKLEGLGAETLWYNQKRVEAQALEVEIDLIKVENIFRE